jgi:hypothetical protein
VKNSIYFLIVCAPFVFHVDLLMGSKFDDVHILEETDQDIPRDDEEIILESDLQKKEDFKERLLWRAAKIVGSAALLGLLAYSVFTAPRSSLTEQAPIVSQLPVVRLPKNEQKVENTRLIRDENANNVPNTIFDVKKPLTPQEIALYQLRYENYGKAAIWGALSTTAGLLIAGPVALSGAAALHYKKKLNPNFLKMPDRIDPVMFTLTQ